MERGIAKRARPKIDYLAVERQMVSELSYHDVGQQPGGRDALVDDLRRNRCLDQCSAVDATLIQPIGKNAALVMAHKVGAWASEFR